MSETKKLTEGTIIGRAFNKLQAINDAEAVELNASPANIRDKFEARRQVFLASLDAGVRAKVLRLVEDDGPDSE